LVTTLAAPQARGVGDRVLGGPALLAAGREDLGAVAGADKAFAKSGRWICKKNSRMSR